jgi:hypothetical protein
LQVDRDGHEQGVEAFLFQVPSQLLLARVVPFSGH